MPTWLTGAFVSPRMARSARLVPRNNQMSPVRASSTARSSVITSPRIAVSYPTMRWWKWVGLAGLAGVAATGVVTVAAERKRRAYTPDEIRERLPRTRGRGRRRPSATEP